MVASQLMKTALLVSFLLRQGFLGRLELFLEILVLWMKQKIHLGSYQILHINDLTSYVVGTKMEASALVYLAYFP